MVLFVFVHGDICKQGFPSGASGKPMQKTQETKVRFLCWEYPLEEEMATYSSILAWKIPWAEEPGGLHSKGSQNSWTRLSTYTHMRIISQIPKLYIWWRHFLIKSGWDTVGIEIP